ncbi:hypothetical protein N9544_00860 [Flavobacteriales bacterium]|nr:hypothetical protein [Flavobacteriales bacterium]
MSGNYENSFHYFILLLHVIGGIVSLIKALIALFARKGGTLHKKSGLIYFWSMFIIFLTALILVIFFKFRFFLFAISIFSFFMAFTGYRALKRKKPNEVEWFDKVVAYIGVLSGLGLIGYGIWSIVKHNSYGFASICLVFGFLLTANAYKDIKHFKKKEYEKMWWWFHHLNMMCASFISAVTAFLVNRIYTIIDLGDYNFIFWLLPTFIMVPLMNKWNRYYKKKFKM